MGKRKDHAKAPAVVHTAPRAQNYVITYNRKGKPQEAFVVDQHGKTLFSYKVKTDKPAGVIWLENKKTKIMIKQEKIKLQFLAKSLKDKKTEIISHAKDLMYLLR